MAKHKKASSRTRPVRSQEEILPSSARLIEALRQIGYSLEHAISDLIDNSINAKASEVLVRFVTDEKAVVRVIIADDGDGMKPGELSEAMRFGTESDYEPGSLGKFGLGLKLASFSQAKQLTVLTRKSGKSQGRRWTVEGISTGWKCDVISPSAAATEIEQSWGDLDLSRSGTLVIWDDIDKIDIGKRGVDKTLQRIFHKLGLHAGLHLHRFLETGQLKVSFDHQRLGEDLHSIRHEVEALNPFGYAKSGAVGFPKTYRAELPTGETVALDAHIWPPNSDVPEYKLDRRASSRQGFYFYRNDRLIQAGGWCGLRDSEPHTSLARVRIDLSPSLDEHFGLNVQKSAVIVPEAFVDAVSNGRTRSGDTFKQFAQIANKTYRKKDSRAHDALPLVPGDGLKKSLLRSAKTTFSNGESDTRSVSFEWKALAHGGLFEVDHKTDTIYLNQGVRTALRKADSGRKGTDVPVTKLLLFFALSQDLDRDRMSKKRKAELDALSQLLVQALE